MGTRSGSVDPGSLIHRLQNNSGDFNELDHALNRESGLLGISGVSGDMRDVLKAMRAGNERAQLAFDIFVHRLQAGIAAMATSLGGIDVLVFTAGMGENSPEVRAAACEKLGFLGIEVDGAKNSAAQVDAEISSVPSKTRVLVVRAQEDWSIARACVGLSRRDDSY
jgi:acetate kinase